MGTTTSNSTTTTTAMVSAMTFASSELGVIACAICGALVFIMWEQECSKVKRVAYGAIGAILGCVLAPIMEVKEVIPAIPVEVWAIIISSMSVTLLNKVLDLFDKMSIDDILNKFGGK